MDGHYHSTIVLTRWPKMTFPGIIHRLTNLRLLDYTITVNVDPIPIRKEISREEKAHERLAGDYASEKKLSLLTVMQKKERKIAALMQGHTLPFNALFVVRVWDKTKAGLSAKATAIKNAINSMNCAQYFESSLPSTTQEAILPDMARLAVGPLRLPEALRRTPIPRRHAAGELDVHRTSRNRRGDLRRRARPILSASKPSRVRRVNNRHSTPCCSA